MGGSDSPIVFKDFDFKLDFRKIQAISNIGGRHRPTVAGGETKAASATTHLL